MITLKEALNTSETDIIDNTVLTTVLEPAKANLVVAPLAVLRVGPSSIKGSSVDIPVGNKDAMFVHKIAEGAEIPLGIKDYTKITLTPIKYGLRPMITQEMIEDSMIDVISGQLSEAGYQMAKKLDTLCVAALDAAATAAGGNFDQGSQASLSFTNMTLAIKSIRDYDYNPSHMIVSPAGLQDLQLLDSFTEADKFGSDEMQKTGVVGKILGLVVLVTTQSITTDSGTLAYIFDRRYAFAIGEKRPVTIVKFTDNARDMQNIAITARWDVKKVRNESTAVITTT